jgi:hypothetical protein
MSMWERHQSNRGMPLQLKERNSLLPFVIGDFIVTKAGLDLVNIVSIGVRNEERQQILES